MRHTFLNTAFSPLLMMAAVGLTLVGCSKEKDLEAPNELPGADMPAKVAVGSLSSNTSYQTLFAGKTIDAGTVNYDDIDTNGDNIMDALEIQYNTTNGWQLTQVHFFVGSMLAELPVNKSGNPVVGQFPYKSGDITGQTTYKIVIPFTTLGFSCGSTNNDYFVAAHAALRKPLSGGGYQTESGWGDGQRIVERGNWAMSNVIYITCDVPPPPVAEATTESAFAYNNKPEGCFQNFSVYLDNPNRWGWTNGLIDPGTTTTMPIYAAAGQCDIAKGTQVGTLKVEYYGTTATVTYQLSGTNTATGMPYSLKEAHLYAGSAMFPVNKQGETTIAPGQYPHKKGSLSGQTTSFSVTGLDGSIYVIAHAVVHGFPKQQSTN